MPGPRAYYASSFGIRMSICGQNFPLSIINYRQIYTLSINEWTADDDFPSRLLFAVFFVLAHLQLAFSRNCRARMKLLGNRNVILFQPAIGRRVVPAASPEECILGDGRCGGDG
jgi:hypothetical protein